MRLATDFWIALQPYLFFLVFFLKARAVFGLIRFVLLLSMPTSNFKSYNKALLISVQAICPHCGLQLWPLVNKV